MFDGRGFHDVVQAGTGAVGVDIVDIGRVNFCFPERQPHRKGRPLPVGLRPRQAIGIERRTVPGDLSINLRPTSLGVLKAFHDQDRGPFSQHKAVTSAIKRPRDLRRLSVRPTHRVHGRVGHQHQGVEPAIAAPSHHHIGIAPANQPKRLAHRLGTSCAGCDNGVIGPHGPVHDRKMGGRHVRKMLE